MSSITTAVDADYRLQKLVQLVKECQNRPFDMTVEQWCDTKGISKSNYYYRLRCIRKACLEHIPEGKIVISDRYILSSLILQEMDGVGTEFILNTNSEIIKPDLQLAVIADEKILQERLSERDVLTRFEKENQSKRELDFMEKGVRELGKHNIDIMNIYNNDNLDENVEKVISYIADRWRKV